MDKRRLSRIERNLNKRESMEIPLFLDREPEGIAFPELILQAMGVNVEVYACGTQPSTELSEERADREVIAELATYIPENDLNLE